MRGRAWCSRRISRLRVLADSAGFYARELGLPTVKTRNPVLTGILLWWRARRYDRVVVLASGPSFKTVMLLERLWPRGRRSLVLLDFIPVDEASWANLDRSGRVTRWGRRAFQQHIIAPVLRTSLARAHVLSSWEPAQNAITYGVDPDRFKFVPFPLTRAGDALPEMNGRGLVVASGRALCDWPTVFAAAEGQDWDLEVVCGADDLQLVRRLSADSEAALRHDIPLTEHRALMRQAAVYLLALQESHVSSGQLRVFDAVRGGAPIVASSVRGLADYLTDGETALLFKPGDACAAREAVNRLLADRQLAERLRRTAFERGQERTRERYLAAIRALIEAS